MQISISVLKLMPHRHNSNLVHSDFLEYLIQESVCAIHWDK